MGIMNFSPRTIKTYNNNKSALKHKIEPQFQKINTQIDCLINS